MESKSGKICRTTRFRWVRKRVKIVSRDESWPEKERQAKGKKMHSKISLFSNFLFGFTVFFPKPSFLPPPSRHFWPADEKTRIHGVAGWGNFTDGLVRSVMKMDPRRGHSSHRAASCCNADLTLSNNVAAKQEWRAESRGWGGRATERAPSCP